MKADYGIKEIYDATVADTKEQVTTEYAQRVSEGVREGACVGVRWPQAVVAVAKEQATTEYSQWVGALVSSASQPATCGERMLLAADASLELHTPHRSSSCSPTDCRCMLMPRQLTTV